MEKIKKMFKSVSSKNGTYSVGLTVLVLVIAVLVTAGLSVLAGLKV